MFNRPHREYELTVRQEPKQARMCGVGADRRPIDPPPIIQLRVIDPQTRQPPSPARLDGDDSDPSYAHSFLQNPYYFMFASLAKPDDDTELHWLKDGKTRCTTGSVVSSLYHLKDTENRNEDAGFFVFPDLSVRTEGSYRLKLSLFEVVSNTVRHCKSIYSAPFYVYTAKKFPGMEESTPLSCSLADQGIKIRIRKDIRVRKRPIAALTTPIDTENNNNEEDENDTPVSAVTSSGHSKRPRHGTVSSNGAPDLQTPTGSLVGLPAWPSSTSLDPMLGAPSAPGGVELPAPTHPPPSAPPGGAIPPPRGASYESSRLGGSIPPPPGAQLIAPPAAAVFENSRSAPPSIAPASSAVSQRQTMHPPAQTAPFSPAAPVFNSQGRVTYEASRTSSFDSPRSAYEGGPNQRPPFENSRGAYEQPDQRGYESSRTAYESPPQRTAYPSGYDGQSATSSTFQEPYPSAGQYSSQPTTSSQYQHPSSSHQQYPSSSRPQSQYGAPPSNTYPTPTPYSQSQSRYEYPPQQPQQYASPNGDSYYESSPAASSGPSHSHGQPSYYPSSQSSAHPPSWNTPTPTPPANPQPYSSSAPSHTQSYEFSHQQPYPNSSASDYYQPSNSTHSQAHPPRVTSPAPSRYANQSYTGPSNEQAYPRHQQSTYASASAGGYSLPPPPPSQHSTTGSHHEWPVASPASTWSNSASEHGLIQLAPLRQHPSSSARQHASSSSSSSSDASSPVAGNTNTPGGGGGGGGGAYPLIQLSRAPFEHDARVGLQGKKNVLSIGSIISDGA
ncbi:velvet factor-domain-containing protein [Suillus plorans]|uniref:Velvet factor-domain-containing protein n=1 Tax=Suillus plorans TaxID=116603 RepID=A0A9P7E4H9_9AGAM|nr:velvet factor-domain-containing protein [Suillus plorans]KAG1810473.1 velvet factor-domain-containing protein [Suillus plorans]